MFAYFNDFSSRSRPRTYLNADGLCACMYIIIYMVPKLIIHIFTYHLDKAHQSSRVPSRLSILTVRTTKLQPLKKKIVKLLFRNERGNRNGNRKNYLSGEFYR